MKKLFEFAVKMSRAGLIIILTLVFSFAVAAPAISAEEGAFPGDTAPDFSLRELETEEEISLHQIEEEFIILNFWTTWCPACQQEMPELQQLQEEHGGEIAVIAVNIGQSATEVSDYIEEENFTFTVLLDKTQQVANQYLVRGVPTTFIINEDKVIEERHVGPMSFEQKLDLLQIAEE